MMMIIIKQRLLFSIFISLVSLLVVLVPVLFFFFIKFFFFVLDVHHRSSNCFTIEKSKNARDQKQDTKRGNATAVKFSRTGAESDARNQTRRERHSIFAPVRIRRWIFRRTTDQRHHRDRPSHCHRRGRGHQASNGRRCVRGISHRLLNICRGAERFQFWKFLFGECFGQIGK